MTAPDPLHVPEGRGHPYDHGDEERVPLLPIAGEPVRLGIVPGRPPAGAVVEIETRAGAGRGREEPTSEHQDKPKKAIAGVGV